MITTTSSVAIEYQELLQKASEQPGVLELITLHRKCQEQFDHSLQVQQEIDFFNQFLPSANAYLE